MSGTATRTRHQNTSPVAQLELGAGLVRQVLPVADQTGARSGREDGHTRKGAPGIVAKGKQEERECSTTGNGMGNFSGIFLTFGVKVTFPFFLDLPFVAGSSLFFSFFFFRSAD